MRPRSLRELTEMAREEMAPTEEERGRVYDSLRLALAAGAAGAGLTATATASAAVSTSAAASSTVGASTAAAASTTASSTTAASTTAAASGAAAQGGALAAGAAQAGGALTLSSGLLLKSLVLLVAVGGGAGMMTMGSEGGAPDPGQHVRTEEAVPLRRETTEPMRVPPEAPLAAQALGVQEEATASPRSGQGRPLVDARRRAIDNEEPADADESQPSRAGAALTRAARRLQGAQRAMARGDGAAALALLAEDGDPRLQAERLALRVLALCQVGDEEGARSEADKLRALDDASSAALARIGNSCVGP